MKTLNHIHVNPMVSMLASQQQMNFSSRAREMFKTPTPAQSQRYHFGLFHGKTHHQRKKRCFSMKYRIETQKPNIHRRKLKSDILGQTFRLWISTKARKCIMKAGSLDNYLLTTKPSRIDSKFGLFVRSLIEAKQADPQNFKLNYVPGQATIRRTRKSEKWHLRRLPTVWVPAQIKATRDLSEFYEKPPTEMSRYELEELERLLLQTEEDREAEQVDNEQIEAVFDEDGNQLTSEEMFRLTDEYRAIQEQVHRLQPMRIGAFKRYWDRFKLNKNKREEIMQMFDEADEQAKFYYGEDFKGWRDEIEGAREFLDEVHKEKIQKDIQLARRGNTVIRNIKGRVEDLNSQEIEYSTATFNPFSVENVRNANKKITKVYKENDGVTMDTIGKGKASNLQAELTDNFEKPVDVFAKHERSGQSSGDEAKNSHSDYATMTEGGNSTSDGESLLSSSGEKSSDMHAAEEEWKRDTDKLKK